MTEKNELTFEESIEHLEEISSRLSSENVPLDEAISLYEQGVEYYTACKDKLEDANRRISVIEKNVSTEEQI